MIRILGSVLNVSHQTELLIMTLLGLANSTLDWKPFELVSQLNLIDQLHFPVRSDGEISGNFISWIKKLLTLTVVVQFFCSLLNPLAYLLKLYPIITWSRADILLPWLTIHALNTTLPKLLSLVLAFVFYFESMISTMSLIEFLLVETINLLIAWCNWYIFFDFYMDLRAIEKKRELIRQQERKSLRESGKSSYTLSSSIPNLKQGSRVSSAELSELRPVRSLGGLTENLSRTIDYNRNSVSTASSDEALTIAEKTMKILNLTDEELESARIRKGSLNKVLSNTDTVDVKLIDLASPDEISFASLDNSDDSVIIVYDSQDEKELERILSPVEESEHENEVSDSREKEATSDVVDEDLVREEKSLKVEVLPGEGKSVDLPQEEQLLKSRKSDSSREQSPHKMEAYEQETLSKIKKSSLLEEERLLKDKKRYSSREEELFELKKLELPRDEKLFKIQKPDLSRNDNEFVQECVCSSSEDDEDEENEKPVNAPPENFLKRLPIKANTIKSDDFDRKEHYYAERKKSKNKIVQTVDYPDIPLNTLLLSPSAALVPRGNNRYVKTDEKDLPCLLNENFQLLDNMCRAMNFNNQSIPNNSLRKWLIFRHQLESSLDQNAFLKKNDSVVNLMKPRPIGFFNVKDKNTQTEATLKAKKRHKEKRGTLLHYPKTEIIENKWNYLENFPGTSTDMIGKSFPSQVEKSVEPSKISDVSDDKVPHFINIVNFSKTTSTSHSPVDKKLTKLIERPATSDDREKTNISILKTKVPVKCSELDYFSGQKDKDLRNLQAYNKLTLEQDKRELMQKKKKSKMTSYKNVVTELTLRNSDVVPNRLVKVDNRTCKSNQSRTQNAAHSSEPRNRNFNQLFRYNEKLFDQPVETQGISKNPEYQYLEIESCKDKTAPSADTTVLSICHSDTEVPAQGHLRKSGQGLEQIEWLDPSNDSTSRVKSPQVALPSEEDGPRRNIIVDDETVSMLKCAFSFSDESDRGFQLGPEMREPYPIFQVVALTMAEIFKATGWRNFEESLPDNPSDVPVTDVIFCEAELDFDDGDDVVDVLDQLIRAEEEELERRKCLSVSLLEQLQELLKSSRETLSEVENYQSRSDLDDRIDLFDDLCIKDGNVVGEIKPMEACVYTVNEQIFSNPLKEPTESMSIQNSINQTNEVPAETTFRNETLRSSKRDSRGSSTSRNKRDSVRTGVETYRSRIHETKFENKVQKHHCRKGEGLSSGNVMEFDSEGRALNAMNCPSGEAISERDNESTDELIKTFNSFCDKFMDTEPDDVQLEKNLKTLAKSEKFLKFMSLFEETDLKILKEKMNSEENEVVLSTSDFASNETMREAFVESGKEEPSISVDKKKENPAKLNNQEYDIMNAFSSKNVDLPSADIGIPYSQKLKNHREYLESANIKKNILNWRNESVDSMNSLDYPKKRKLEETRSFSDNSDIEEFPVN